MSFWKKDKPHLLAASRQMAEQGITPTSAVPSSASRGSAFDDKVENDKGQFGAVETGISAFERCYGTLKSALSAGTVIDGRLSFDVAVRIDGRLSGELYSSQPVIVGPEAVISANIEVPTLIVFGTVKGIITANDKVDIQPGGNLEADITTPVFTVAEGAVFNGKISVGSAEIKSVGSKAVA